MKSWLGVEGRQAGRKRRGEFITEGGRRRVKAGRLMLLWESLGCNVKDKSKPGEKWVQASLRLGVNKPSSPGSNFQDKN